jgi:hypothetical protein
LEIVELIPKTIIRTEDVLKVEEVDLFDIDGSQLEMEEYLEFVNDEDHLKENPLDKQVGGNHYKDLKIQPIEFTLANKLGFCEGNIIKYVTRHKAKNGKQDLEKAKHYIELLIESEYGNE